MSTTQRRVAVIGCGLIGGSIARALHGRPEVALTVFDSDSATNSAMRADGLAVADYARVAAYGADVVVLAVPDDDLVDAVASIRSGLKPGVIVMDTSTAKQESGQAHAMLRQLSPDAHYVTTCPIAGIAERGFEYADPELFRDATWVVGAPDEDRNAVAEIKQFAQALGAAQVLTHVAPERHDLATAAVSHAPQLLVSAVAAELGTDPAVDRRAVPGELFDRAFRLAASPAGSWPSTIAHNSAAIRRVLWRYTQSLDELAFSIGLEHETRARLELLRAQRSGIEVRFPSDFRRAPVRPDGVLAMRAAALMGIAILSAAANPALDPEVIDLDPLAFAGPSFGDSTALALWGLDDLAQLAARRDHLALGEYQTALALVERAVARVERIVEQAATVAPTQPKLMAFGIFETESVGETIESPLLDACVVAANGLYRTATTRADLAR